jgi:NADPH-dependent ferric siderophore reductase
MVRVVLGGDGFAGFVDNGFTDRYVKLVFPAPGHLLPEPLDFGRIRATLPPEQWPRVRTYTVRSHDPASRELAIDFVVHGDGGVAGPWAASAAPGDGLTLLGPGGAYAPRADADGHLLVGDDSAVPAIAAALEAMLPGAPVRAVVEVGGPDDELELTTRGDLDLTWLHRDNPGYRVDGTLVDAVRSLAFRPGRVQVFAHGELAAMRELRPHLLRERGVDIELLSLSGYWRRGKDEDGFQAEKADDARREREAAARD